MSRSIDTDLVAKDEPPDAGDQLTAEKPDKPDKPDKPERDDTVAADDGIEGLKRQLADEKSRREASERRAREAETEVYQAKAEVEGTNLTLIGSAIETIRLNTASLEEAYAQAMQGGDYRRTATIQKEMARNEAKLLALENGKQALEERPRTPPPQQDPVEALARQLTPRSAAWVRAHPECATDQRLYQKMLAAHNLTVADGVEPDSDEYFDKVESVMGLKRAKAPVVDDDDDDDGTAMAARPVQRRSSPAAAPVSRSGQSGDYASPTRARLSPEEREIAKLSNLTDEEYYRQQQRVRRENKGRMH